MSASPVSAVLLTFRADKRARRLAYLCVLFIAAMGEFAFTGLTRRTFVFYSNLSGEETVEDRMLKKAGNRETDIRRYVEEALLGPVSPDSAPLFPRDTRLVSLLYRDGSLWTDLSAIAALPAPGERTVYRGFYTLYQGVRRNFPYLKEVRLFVDGNEVYYEELAALFPGKK